MTTPVAHCPVLIEDVLRFLNPQAGGVYVDATFGRGGYTRQILEKADCSVIALDRDEEAIVAGALLKKEFGDRLTLIQGTFSHLDDLMRAQGITSVDGIVFDLGVSSPQLDTPARGFSFLNDGPLDMRMGQSGTDAKTIINNIEESELAHILWHFGEERKSRRIASAVVRARAEKPIETTLELADIILSAVGRRPQDKIHPATRTFQAIRIYINDELDELKAGLAASERLLHENGVLVVVSFHSLEDRIVKLFLQERTQQTTSRLLPGERPKPTPTFQLLTRKVVMAGEDELRLNPRSRSARLRAAARIRHPVKGGRP